MENNNPTLDDGFEEVPLTLDDGFEEIPLGVEKKNPIGNVSPIGGKVGASEIPSTGNSPFLEKAKGKALSGAPTALSVKEGIVTPIGGEAIKVSEKEAAPFAAEKSAYSYGKEVSDIAKYLKVKNSLFLTAESDIKNTEATLKSMKQKFDEISDLVNDETIHPDQKNEYIKQYNEIIPEYQNLADEYNKKIEVFNKGIQGYKTLNSQMVALEGLRQQGLEKEYSSFKNLLQQIPKAVVETGAGLSNIFNTLGMSGDPEDPEIKKQVVQETRDNITKLREFGNSLVTQELPTEYESLFEGKLSPKKLAIVTSNAIASTTPTIAAGLIGGAPAAVVAGGSQAFGESKDILKSAGLTDEQSEWASLGLAIPLGLLENYGAEDIVKLISKDAVKATASKLATKLAGKQLTKEALFNEAKNTLGEVIKEQAPKIVLEGIKEGATEGSQGLVNEAAKQIAQEYTGKDSDESLSTKEYLSQLGKQIGEDVVGGFLGGTTMAGGVVAPSAAKAAFKPSYTPSAYKQAIELSDPQKMEAFKAELQKEIEQGVINEGQANEAINNIQSIQEANVAIPEDITNQDLRTEAVNLIIEKKNIEQSIENKDEALIKPQKARIEEINKRLEGIANGEKVLEDIEQPTEVVESPAFETDATEAAQPSIKEADFATKQKEKRDAEIAEVQQLRSDLGQDVELINDIPSFVDDIVDRIDLGMTVAPVMAKDAILELDKQFDKLQAYKKDPLRTHTTAQIDAMIDVLSAVKSEIQDYQIKQEENGQKSETTAPKTEPAIATTSSIEGGQETTPQEGSAVEGEVAKFVNNFEAKGNREYPTIDKAKKLVAKLNTAKERLKGLNENPEETLGLSKSKSNFNYALNKTKKATEIEIKETQYKIDKFKREIAKEAEQNGLSKDEVLKEVEQLLGKKYEQTTQEENAQPLSEGVSGVRTETEERQTSPELRSEEKEVTPSEAFTAIEQAKKSKKIPSEKVKAMKEAVKSMGKIGQDAIFVEENFDAISEKLTKAKNIPFKRIC